MNHRLDHIQTKFYSLAERLIQYRLPILIFITIMFLIMSIGLIHFRTTVSIKNLFLPDDPVILDQNHFEDLFGNSDFAGFLVESPHLFSPEGLSKMQAIEETLISRIPWASRTSSIINFATFHGKALPDTEEKIVQLKADLDQRGLKGRLYSSDYSQAWILLSLEKYPEITDHIDEPSMIVGKTVMNILSEFQEDGYRIIPTGIPVLQARKSAEFTSDLIVVFIIAGVIALGTILLFIRSLKGVIGSILVIALGTCSIFGVMGWLRMIVDTTFLLLPPLLTIAVSIGYTIHINNFYKRSLKKHGCPKTAVIEAMAETSWPILFTALTTIFALLSFSVVQIKAVQWVGFASGASVFIVLLLTIFFYPLILSFGQKKKPLQKSAIIKPGLLPDYKLEKMGIFLLNHGKLFSILFIICLAICGSGMYFLKVDLDTNKMTGNKLSHSKDQIYITASEIGATNSYNISIDNHKTGKAIDLELLLIMEDLIDEIKRHPAVKGVSSINDLYKGYERQLAGGAASQEKLPETQQKLNGLHQLLKRLLGDQLPLWLNEDAETLRIQVEIMELSTLELTKHLEEIDRKAKELFSDFPDLTISMTGGILQITKMNQYVTKGLVTSILTALGIISIMLMIVLRSVRLGLIAMIPNITPLIIAGGIMGFAGESLEFVTMTIAPMILGLAVDDTIHFISHIKTNFPKFGNYDQTIIHSYSQVGKALIQTTIILCLTFTAFLFSKVHSMNNMGFYLVLALASALIADFTITPWLIKKLQPFGKETR